MLEWLIFVDARVYTKSNSAISRANNSECSGPCTPITSIIRLNGDLLVIYTVTKFGANWFIFADARV